MNRLPQVLRHQALMDRTRNWTLGLLLLTSVHHALGALLYAAPFRLHVVAVALPLAALIAWLMQAARHRIHTDGSGHGVLLASLAMVFLAILGIGVFEGGYNHVLKDILFFMGVTPHTMATLFPPPAYEMPDNFLFEATGILQFPVGLIAASAAIKLLRHRIPDHSAGVPVN